MNIIIVHRTSQPRTPAIQKPSHSDVEREGTAKPVQALSSGAKDTSTSCEVGLLAPGDSARTSAFPPLVAAVTPRMMRGEGSELTGYSGASASAFHRFPWPILEGIGHLAASWIKLSAVSICRPSACVKPYS